MTARCLECGRPESEHTGGADDGTIACPDRVRPFSAEWRPDPDARPAWADGK